MVGVLERMDRLSLNKLNVSQDQLQAHPQTQPQLQLEPQVQVQAVTPGGESSSGRPGTVDGQPKSATGAGSSRLGKVVGGRCRRDPES
jgi:hypothetical protein